MDLIAGAYLLKDSIEKLISKLAITIMVILMSGCSAVPSHYDRTLTAERLVIESGWRSHVFKTNMFNIQAYISPDLDGSSEVIHVYIEGDGFAWRTRSQPSNNPTPINPLALRLALKDPSKSVIYLARPCQYAGIEDPSCNSNYWTNKRFSAEIIDAYQEVLDVLKDRYRTESFTLVGYSGGGAITALLSARRNNVQALITVAGNLDTQYWTKLHNISELSGSLNPADDASNLVDVPQWHFVGEDDNVMPPSVAQHFTGKFTEQHRPNLIIIPDYTHHCCWTDNWQELLMNLGDIAK